MMSLPVSPEQASTPSQGNARTFRLGMISGDLFSHSEDGHLMTNHAYGRLVDAIRRLVPNTKLCVPIVPLNASVSNHRLELTDADLVRMPMVPTVVSAQKHAFTIRRTIKQFAQEMDVLMMRCPFQVPRALLGLGKPKLVQVIGDADNVIKASQDYRGMWKLLARAYAWDGVRATRRLMQEPFTHAATHGEALWHKMHCRAGRSVVSSCIYRDEMVPRQNLDLGNPPSILFVGYLRPEKGVAYLLEAFERVRRTRPLKLTIVGGTDRLTAAEGQMKAQIESSEFHEDITVTGSIPFGEQLFDLYRSHDLFVLASLSEGTPRTLVEARSFGCPVIASSVGGVPNSVRDGIDGLLVPPADSQAIADAMTRVLDDDALRRRLIAEGLDRTRQLSIEDFAEQLVQEITLAWQEQQAAATSR